jgi:protein ImuA
MRDAATLAELRNRIRGLERPGSHAHRVLPFGIPDIDTNLPEGGLPLGTLHETAGGGVDEVPAAAAALFTAGILARLDRGVLWCGTGTDLFPPGLACAGLGPERIMYAKAPDEKTVLLVMEEALRHSGLSAVVGELARLPMTASRRLVLAAEKSGVMAVALRRRPEGKTEDTTVTAAATRWRITPLPSAPLDTPGIGRARWCVQLTRCRGGTENSWMMEACDAQGRLGPCADLADRSLAAPLRRRA